MILFSDDNIVFCIFPEKGYVSPKLGCVTSKHELNVDGRIDRQTELLWQYGVLHYAHRAVKRKKNEINPVRI